MRLKKLKLSGFKSFVDPTNVLFPSNRVGVVGPNGCGKSNIIDAIRWVMGEISAKHLRGSTMSDIIFNGSSHRKPVGQASVELVFDNTETRLIGEYSQYAELSLRRVVSRDGQSNYYLNGTRCRRKDIADIFMGTGLGARSYAIIGQNTISQMIEAKPDELRLFIEEAANISKYKDRRADAQGRMENTRDNLARVSDSREEMDKQVARLERQAKAANLYNEWKQEAQTLHLECDIMRWKQWHIALKEQEHIIQTLTVERENFIQQRQACNQQIMAIKMDHHTTSDMHQKTQAGYYQLGIESARLKESMLNHQKHYEQLTFTHKKIASDLTTISQHLAKEQDNLNTLSHQIHTLTAQLTALTQNKENAEKDLAQSEIEKQNWQKNWDHFNQLAANAIQKRQVHHTQITHSENNIQQSEEKLKQLESEKNSLENPQALNSTIHQWEQEDAQLKTEWETLKQTVETTTQTISLLREQHSQKQHAVDAAQKKLQQLQGELIALHALQEAALGKKEETLKQWLKNKPFAEASRLTHHLDVMDGWEKAVEHLLGTRLQGFCVDDFSAFGDLDELTQSLPKGECLFINFTAPSSCVLSSPTHDTLIPLADQIKIHESLTGIQHWFQHIYIADTLKQAQTLLLLIKDHESIITRDGAWLGKNWLRWVQGKQGHHGIIQREQAIKTLTQRIEEQKQAWETGKEVYEAGQREIMIHETNREKLNERAQAAHQRWMNHNAHIRIKKNQLDTLQEKHQHIERDILDQKNALKHAIIQKATLQKEWTILSEEAQKNERIREAWHQSREKLYQQYEICQTNAQRARDNWHACEITLTRLKTEQMALQKNSIREQENKVSLEKRLQHTIEQLKKTESVNVVLSAQWEDISQKHATEAMAVENANKALKDLDEQLKKHDQTQQQLDIHITALQHQLEKKRLDAQTLKVKCENIEEAMAPLPIHPSEHTLPENMDISEWEKSIQTLNNKIQKLGPINLAALDEFNTESERKKQLDEQYHDLINALAMLETAINTIDEETRVRFEETYQQINEAFQNLFPRLFGGGRATMALTQADCLEAGVTIMAQPPGKRNSSIHLLSGGEKAMTAIALVFAIFQLNPSPFCLLDEVDAPLDDINVGRFCHMVKEMSEQVQFIFITHNKITMELASHLSGITMHEPGVSRLVTVDVDEAVSLVQ